MHSFVAALIGLRQLYFRPFPPFSTDFFNQLTLAVRAEQPVGNLCINPHNPEM
jgi:hypothetical protein